MEIDLKSRDVELSKNDRKRSIKLYCDVHGIEEDYPDIRTPRNVKYSLEAHEDSIGTALNNLYRISIVMIEQALIEETSIDKYKSLDDVLSVSETEADGEEIEFLTKGSEVIRKFLASKLMNLQIGEVIDLSFDEVRVKFGMYRF